MSTPSGYPPTNGQIRHFQSSADCMTFTTGLGFWEKSEEKEGGGGVKGAGRGDRVWRGGVK